MSTNVSDDYKKLDGLLTNEQIIELDISDDIKYFLFNLVQIAIIDIINGKYDKKKILSVQKTILMNNFNQISIDKILNNINLNHTKQVILVKKYKETIEKLYSLNIKEIVLNMKNFVDIYNSFVNNNIIDKSIEICISELSENIRENVFKVYYNMKKLSSRDPEYIHKTNWINTVLDLPKSYKSIEIKDKCEIIGKIKKYIDSIIYGMDDVKIKVISMLLSYVQNPNSKNNNLALLGSPGIGKTKLLKNIADAIGLPFSQISVGSCHDAGYLVGCSSFYQNSKTGAIVDSITKMKYKNGIILFDEIDKINDSMKGSEIQNTLLHVCDSTQNKAFVDEFLTGIEIDLSGYFIVFTLNNKNNISGPMKSRINIVQVKNYTKEEKVNIIKIFTIPDLIKNIEGKMIFSDNIINNIIKNYCNNTNDIRELNNVFSNIVKILDYFTFIDKKNYSYPMKITEEHIKKALGESNNDTNFNLYI
jgi:ATP-dependent Lon protease